MGTVSASPGFYYIDLLVLLVALSMGVILFILWRRLLKKVKGSGSEPLIAFLSRISLPAFFLVAALALKLNVVREALSLSEKFSSYVEAAVVFANSITGLEEDFLRAASGKLFPADHGAYRILLEEHLFFDVIDPGMDLSPYKLIILPDAAKLDDRFAAKLNAFLRAGGAIICSAWSGVHYQTGRFALPIPLTVDGAAPVVPEFILAQGEFLNRLPDTPIVMYETGLAVRPAGDVETLAQTYRPYFNREAGRFCSHQHWPVEGPSGRPAVVRAGPMIYFAHPIFSAYSRYAVKHYKQMVANAIDLLMPQRLLRSNLPSTAHVDLLAGGDKIVLSVLHYVPEKRSDRVATIEEGLPLIDVRLDLRTPSQVKEVHALLPEDQKIKWFASGRSVKIDVDKMVGKLFLELTL